MKKRVLALGTAACLVIGALSGCAFTGNTGGTTAGEIPRVQVQVNPFLTKPRLREQVIRYLAFMQMQKSRLWYSGQLLIVSPPW